MTNKSKVLCTFSLMLVYSVCFSTIKAGQAFAPPFFFAGVRAFIGGVALLGLTVALRRPLIPDRRNWLPVLLLSIIGTTLVYGAMFVRILLCSPSGKKASERRQAQKVEDMIEKGQARKCGNSC